MATIEIVAKPTQTVTVEQTGAAETDIEAAPTATSVEASTVGEQGPAGPDAALADDVETLEQSKATRAEVNDAVAQLVASIEAVNNKVRFVEATTTTGAGTAAKVVTLAGYTPSAGDIMVLTLNLGNTATTSPTVNINGLGAQNIFLAGAAMSAGVSATIAGGLWIMRFDGTRWHMYGSPFNAANTNTSEMEAGTVNTVRVMTPAQVRTNVLGVTAGTWHPSDNNLIAANFNPALVLQGFAAPTGFVYPMRVRVPGGKAITNVHNWISVAGAGLTYAAIGVYEANGTRVGITGDLITSWQTNGLKVAALGAPVAAQQGARYVYVVLAAAGTTMPSYAMCSTYMGNNTNLTGANLASGYIAQAAPLPASLTMANMSPYYEFWVGLS